MTESGKFPIEYVDDGLFVPKYMLQLLRRFSGRLFTSDHRRMLSRLDCIAA